jgi:hypothetical protein
MPVDVNKLITGMQIGAGVLGTIGTLTVTKSIFDEAKELLPYAIGGVGLLGAVVIIIKFA